MLSVFSVDAKIHVIVQLTTYQLVLSLYRRRNLSFLLCTSLESTWAVGKAHEGSILEAKLHVGVKLVHPKWMTQ